MITFFVINWPVDLLVFDMSFFMKSSLSFDIKCEIPTLSFIYILRGYQCSYNNETVEIMRVLPYCHKSERSTQT